MAEHLFSSKVARGSSPLEGTMLLMMIHLSPVVIALIAVACNIVGAVLGAYLVAYWIIGGFLKVFWNR